MNSELIKKASKTRSQASLFVSDVAKDLGVPGCSLISEGTNVASKVLVSPRNLHQVGKIMVGNPGCKEFEGPTSAVVVREAKVGGNGPVVREYFREVVHLAIGKSG